MGWVKHAVLAVGLGFSVTLFASFVEPPVADPLAALLEIIQNWKAWTPLMAGIAITAFLVQALRAFLPDSWQKKAAVVGISLVYSVLLMLKSGSGVLDAIVMVLITGGGATAAYEWIIKPILGKS